VTKQSVKQKDMGSTVKVSSNGNGHKLSPLSFTVAFIEMYRDPSRSQGVHAVYSGYNATFRKFFGADPVEFVKTSVKNGVLESHFARGGAMIYLPGEAPARTSNEEAKANKILVEMGLATS